MLKTITLPGGLKVLIEALPHTHSVSIGCFVRVGSGHETSAQAGTSHFIEHMLFKGSRGYPTPKRISDTIEGVGGMLDAYTEHAATVYHVKVADSHFERALALLADMLINPLFDPRDVEKERRVITEELRETADTPSEFVHTLLDATMWGDQPLGRDIAGTEASIAMLRVADLVEYWRLYYHRSNLIVSIAGRIDPDYAVTAVEQAFQGLPPGWQQPAIPTTAARSGPLVMLEVDDSEQANFALGFAGIAKNDPDRRAMLVFDTILGGGMSSRLVQEIREERGLAYTVGSDRQEYHDAGKWIVYGSVDPIMLAECIEAIMAQLRAIREHGITAAELAQVKEQVKGGILLSLEDTWSVAARNGSHQLHYDQVIPLEQVIAEVEAVTAEDVLRVARRVLREEHMHLAVVGPFDDIDELQQLLRL